MPTATQTAINYRRGRLSDATLLMLYKRMLLPRMIEEKMLILLRQGKISKWFSGIGQEAIAAGATAAMEPDEMIFPMHRNLGVFTGRDIPLFRLFSQWQGKAAGFTKGRDRSFHFGAPEYHIAGMISHLGPQLSLADGTALAHKLKGEQKAALAFTGEGGTSEGEFHEALNVAAVWDLPVIFLIENNGYGLSTPTREQYRCEKLADRARGYGIKGVQIDGNNILEVYTRLRKISAEIRKNPQPVLVEALTFRMRGHEEASGTKYVPKELMQHWAQKDPIANYEKYLLSIGLLDEDQIASIRKAFKEEINRSWKQADAEPPVSSTPEAEEADLFAPSPVDVNDRPSLRMKATTSGNGSSSGNKDLRLVDAISQALGQAMEKHPELVLMGQDIADYGGVFKITEGFVKRFGKERVRNTPICESAIVGAALGLSFRQMKSMVEMQFSDFVSVAFNQIVNNLAKLHYRWGHAPDVVIRMPTGGGVAAGPFHSQSTEAWFFHTPGLKLLYPSTPYDAKGLLLAAFEDPNPVLFFEHKALYRSVSGPVPEEYYTLPIGLARQVRQGGQVSILTYGMGVREAVKTCDELGISADIIDLRSLAPLDWETIEQSVRKTNRVLLLHEDTLTGGIGAELAARISERLFDQLDAPLMRAASLDTPVPFAPVLEEQFMPFKQRLPEALKKLIAY
ncbi:MAG TPA: dehydrogenase [Phaeodactylibacter sp.]|nr:dehydrogenase [Phaeodactylibacter sp.]